MIPRLQAATCHMLEHSAVLQNLPGMPRVQEQIQLEQGSSHEPASCIKQGNEYILVFVDHFTKWPEAFATVSADAATTARIFIDFWICRHGIPDILISDRGSHFLNDLRRMDRLSASTGH